MTNFLTPEILDLMAEVGQVLELCLPGVVRSGNAALAMPARTGWNCRRVSGYVRVDQASAIALTNAPQAAQDNQGLIAVLSAAEVTTAELNNAEARIKFEGNLYQFTYSRGITDRGATQLHEVRLVSTKPGVGRGGQAQK